MHAKPIKLFTVAELAALTLPAFLALCHGEITSVFPRRMTSPIAPMIMLTAFASAAERIS
jgi:hypothetical protein